LRIPFQLKGPLRIRMLLSIITWQWNLWFKEADLSVLLDNTSLYSNVLISLLVHMLSLHSWRAPLKKVELLLLRSSVLWDVTLNRLAAGCPRCVKCHNSEWPTLYRWGSFKPPSFIQFLSQLSLVFCSSRDGNNTSSSSCCYSDSGNTAV